MGSPPQRSSKRLRDREKQNADLKRTRSMSRTSNKVTPLQASKKQTNDSLSQPIRNPYAKRGPLQATASVPQDTNSFLDAPAPFSGDDSSVDSGDSSTKAAFPEAQAFIRPLVPNKPDGSIDFATLTVPTSKEEFSILSILQSIKENPVICVGDNDVASMNFNTSAHEKKKDGIESLFFKCLASHSNVAKSLAELVKDPENPVEKLQQFYVECRAPNTPAKKSLINWALLIFSLGLYKKEAQDLDFSKDPKAFAQAQYQPGTVKLKFKCLFAKFRSQGIVYSFLKDFNGKGQLHAYWKYIFKITKEFRHNYGTQPNKSCFDPNFFKKRIVAAEDPNNPYNPFSNVKHYVWTALENIIYEFNTRGCKEPTSITLNDLEEGIISEGAFAGIPYI